MRLVRLSKSVVGLEEQQAVARVIETGYLGMGKEVQLFEEEISTYLNTSREVICVNTGTAALHLALQAIGVGPGCEVLVPSITYVATFQAISATGAKPIACDVKVDNAFIDLSDAMHRVNSRTKAIIPVHYGSNSQGMDDVFIFAHQHGLRVIEDAAHSFGCIRNGQRIGAFGDITCFSFDGIKNITSGEGGAVVTGDAHIAQKIKDARLLGVEKDTDKRYLGQRSWQFDINQQGWRYHMSNIMAAIGREQLKKIEHFAQVRQSLAIHYVQLLSNFPNLIFLNINYSEVIPHIFPVRITGGLRDQVANALKQQGIETGIHYQPNHLLSFYNDDISLPQTESLYQELLSLPLHPDVTQSDQDQIAYIIGSILKEVNHA